VLVLEFNHDVELLRNGPYPPALQRRILGGAGHLSNEEAARMLLLLAGPELHTLVLAHLSEKNNSPELARAAARGALASIGRDDVRVLVASQDEVGPNLGV
jgi:phosphoribosyl 1,2-cyclic phosphodiesterase